MGGPLFVCHANCSRSVLASYLYRALCGNAPARSAGLDPGDQIAERAEQMLRAWGIDASSHCPTRVSREACTNADAIFTMGPSYLHRLLLEYGEDLSDKTYLFADPFTRPVSFAAGEYRVADPSFDTRPLPELLQQYSWIRERVLAIRLALLGHGRPLVSAAQYLDLCKTVDPASH